MGMAPSADQDNLEYVVVGSSAEIGEGERLEIQIDGSPYLLLRVQGQLYALAAICSHEEELLTDGDLEGHEIICPLHGARFDIRSGEATALPAVDGIQSLTVREKDGQIEIGLPKK